MKRIFLSALVLPVICTVACKKETEKPIPAPAVVSNWTLDSKVYSPYHVSRDTQLKGLVAHATTDTISASVFFLFNSLPTANGNYKVVSNTRPAANEVCITPFGSAIGSYTSTGNDNKTATVTITNSKISISVPSVWVKNITGPADSLQFSASLTEK